MMEYKPGKGYSEGGYTDPKKTSQNKKALSALIFLVGVFSLTAIVFGWWSILVDAGILSYLTWISKKFGKKKLDK